MATEIQETEQKYEAARLTAPRAYSRVTADSTAGDVVLAYLAGQTARLMSLDPAIRRDEPSTTRR
jgi:hypothetical protein